jgi:hypothetical protein
MKRAFLFLTIAVLWSATNLAAATVTGTPRDPRITDPNLINRDWGARLRSFGNSRGFDKIYVGSGSLDVTGNRNAANLTWNRLGTDSFTLTYAPSPPLITMSASGTTAGSQS